MEEKECIMLQANRTVGRVRTHSSILQPDSSATRCAQLSCSIGVHALKDIHIL